LVFQKCTLQFRLPKNQWLFGRRICSLADRCNLLTIFDNFLLPSANETNRLLINHWFFGRRILSLANLTEALKPLVLKHCHFGVSPGGSARCLKTIGFKKRLPGETAADKENALKPLVATRRDALKPLVLRSDSPVRLQNRTSTIGSLVDGSCETRRDGLKPLV
jgi:hypothetical protein